MKITASKRRHCDSGCEYDSTVSTDLPVKVSHQELEAAWGGMKLPAADNSKKHKHHMVNEAWLEVVES